LIAVTKSDTSINAKIQRAADTEQYFRSQVRYKNAQTNVIGKQVYAGSHIADISLLIGISRLPEATRF